MRPIIHQPTHVPSLGLSRQQGVAALVAIVLAVAGAWGLAAVLDGDDVSTPSVVQRDVAVTPMSPRTFETAPAASVASAVRSTPMSPRTFEAAPAASAGSAVRSTPMSPRTFEVSSAPAVASTPASPFEPSGTRIAGR